MFNGLRISEHSTIEEGESLTAYAVVDFEGWINHIYLEKEKAIQEIRKLHLSEYGDENYKGIGAYKIQKITIER